jgi:hypothetical protein
VGGAGSAGGRIVMAWQIRISAVLRAWLCRAAVLLACLPADNAQADPALHLRDPDWLVIFASIETASRKTHAAVGMKRALGAPRLDSSGFRLGVKWGESVEPAERRPRHGRQYRTEFHATLGYERRIGDSFLMVSAGPELSAAYVETRTRRQLSQRLRPRLQIDLWTTPTDTTFVQLGAYIVPGTQSRVWARLAAGWALAPGVYVGPETEAYGEGDYHKLRLGLHLTGLRLLGLRWRIALGGQVSRNEPGGFYAVLGLNWLR